MTVRTALVRTAIQTANGLVIELAISRALHVWSLHGSRRVAARWFRALPRRALLLLLIF
ncbi:MAG: hypothetical protein ACSLE7_01890 [Mycobacterium sp.]